MSFLNIRLLLMVVWLWIGLDGEFNIDQAFTVLCGMLAGVHYIEWIIKMSEPKNKEKSKSNENR